MNLEFNSVKTERKEKKNICLKGWKKISLSDNELSNFKLVNSEINSFEIPLSHGVLFSGGYDSTALLIDLLEQSYSVLPIIFNFNGYKTLLPKLAILNQLKERYPFLLNCYIFNEIFYGDDNENNEFKQQYLCCSWVRHLPYEIRERLTSIDIAYNQLDQGFNLKDILTDLYNASMKLLPFVKTTVNDCKNWKSTERFIPKLEFPFSKQTHEANVSIVKDFEKTYNICIPCSSCECDEYSFYEKGSSLKVLFKPCGNCEKCKSDVYKETDKDKYRVLTFN